MVEPIDIMEAAHQVCVDVLIPNQISPAHASISHAPTSALYAEAINEAGLDVTGPQVIDAIMKVTKWDKKSKWPGHPDPQKVIKKLRG